MSLRFLGLSFVLFSVLFALPLTSNASSTQSLGPGKMTYVIATVAGGPQTVDPALAYDTASGELIQNVYDTLIFFKGSDQGSFVPWLAESYSVSADGTTYQFIVRQNVQWQNVSYGFVTPADIEYSLKKVLVRDYLGGPAWMFWFPIFGTYSANDTGELSNPANAYTIALGQSIDNAITSNATGVTIQFATGKAYLPFLGILANTWGAVQCKQWAIDHGDWNPAVDKLSDGAWVNAHDPRAPMGASPSPLDAPSGPSTTGFMMGSGPYKFDFLNAGIAWSISRNVNFWGGWDTNRASLLGLATTTRGYLDEITEYFVSDYRWWPDGGFVGPNPVYDTIAVPRTTYTSLWQQPGIKCIYPLQLQAVDALFFNYNISMLSPYIGAPANATYFGELGIRPDFFSDVHARGAMAYSFNWSRFIVDAYLGEAEQVGLPLQSKLPFYNSSTALKYGINITQATAEWQQAWDGQVWTSGFNFSIVYNTGNTPRQRAAEILKSVLESENPKFHVNVVSVSWNAYGSVWHGAPDGRALGPIYQVGWLADYPDVDDWVTLFIESNGTFAYRQHIDMDPYSGLMDNLIKNGRYNNTFAGRDANYQQLWQLYHQEASSIPLQQAFGRYWARDWVHGWYFNPSLNGVWGYTLWKENITTSTGQFAGKLANWEDINEDGRVDIKDLATAAKAYGSYFVQPFLPPNPTGEAGYYSPNWNSRADLNIVNPIGGRADMKVDIRDLTTVALLYGFVADSWAPGP